MDIVTIIFMMIVSFGGVIYYYNYEINLREGKEFDKAISITAFKNKFLFLEKMKYISVLVFIIITVFLIVFPDVGILQKVKMLILINTLFLLALIDFKLKIIPNKVLVFLLIVRTLFLMAEVLLDIENWLDIVLQSVYGLGAGFLILFVCLLISRSGIGAGDLKLFAIIGYFSGVFGVINIMFYCFALTAVVSIFLIVFKKYKLKDTVPMVPFIFLGTFFYYFMTIILLKGGNVN